MSDPLREGELFSCFYENKSEKMNGWKCKDVIILINETVLESYVSANLHYSSCSCDSQ